ncbi:MAG TPA: amidase family protein [Gaiellales bacterium]|nr:amidase family protein [Gaiellales bacterium]
MSADLTSLSARDAVAALRAREASPRELVEAALRRIEECDGPLNALPTVCAERALERADAIDGQLALAGLPIAVKDLNDVAGVRTTYGSSISADHVPERSDIMVERLEERGAIVLAKSNTPEFGAGANTFNEVFGSTRNPWDTNRTCGGSSGGSAVALATRQVWLATGSDLGGSLRTPASFCSVVGLRPSPGRVARGPAERPFDTLSVEGPMARDVADCALMLDAMAGPHPEDPLTLPAPDGSFLQAALAPELPGRIAWSDDLGVTPVEREVLAVCRAAVERLAAAGVAVAEAHPDLGTAPDVFGALRAAGYVAHLGPLHETDRDRLKPEIVWNVEVGLAQPPERLGWAERERGRIIHEAAAFLREHTLLACPAACVLPFPVEDRWVAEVEGVRFENYVEALRITSALTLTACPVMAVPCGFTATGLPVGIQLTAPHHGEAALLRAAAAIEAVLGVAGREPPPG